MRDTRTRIRAIVFGAVAVMLVCLSPSAAERGKIRVAVTEPDIASIVQAVGGSQVEAFPLFKGCILRKDLAVEPAAKGKLASADAVVWTGFLNESAAIDACVATLPAQSASAFGKASWIDVSRDASRVNVPASTCTGYVDASFMSGDPFFWLNPMNGAVIARNAAEGLGDLRPASRAYFLANADAFSRSLQKDIVRWKKELAALGAMRIFSAQCGWQNFSQIGGPTFAACRTKPGVLPTPKRLADEVKSLGVQVVIVDPNTPPAYGRAFRTITKARVVEVPSSVEDLQGAKNYGALFDHLVGVLKSVSKG